MISVLYYGLIAMWSLDLNGWMVKLMYISWKSLEILQLLTFISNVAKYREFWNHGDGKTYPFTGRLIFMKDIVNKNCKIMSHKQLTAVYGGACLIQNYNQLIAALLQNWKRQLLKEEIKEFACHPLKITNGLNWLV